MNTIGSKFKQRAAVCSALSVLLLVGLALAVSLVQFRSIDAESAARALETAQSVQGYIQDQNRQRLEQVSRSIAINPGFVSYITQALSPDVATGAKVDVISIRDLLEERRSDLGIDFAAIVQLDGHVIAATGKGGTRSLDLSRDPLFVQASQTADPTSRLWTEENRVLLMTLTPILQGTTMQALLLTGLRSDASSMKEIARVGHAGAALVVVDKSELHVAASSLDPSVADQLALALTSQRDRLPNGSGSTDIDVSFSGQPWSLRIAYVAASPDKIFSVSLLPPAASQGTLNSIVQPMLLAVASASILSLIVFFGLWRNHVRPLGDLSDLCERAIQGDYALNATVKGDVLSIHLARTFNHLLTALDGYRPRPGEPHRRGTDRKQLSRAVGKNT